MKKFVILFIILTIPMFGYAADRNNWKRMDLFEKRHYLQNIMDGVSVANIKILEIAKEKGWAATNETYRYITSTIYQFALVIELEDRNDLCKKLINLIDYNIENTDYLLEKCIELAINKIYEEKS